MKAQNEFARDGESLQHAVSNFKYQICSLVRSFTLGERAVWWRSQWKKLSAGLAVNFPVSWNDLVHLSG